MKRKPTVFISVWLVGICLLLGFSLENLTFSEGVRHGLETFGVCAMIWCAFRFTILWFEALGHAAAYCPREHLTGVMFGHFLFGPLASLAYYWGTPEGTWQS